MNSSWFDSLMGFGQHAGAQFVFGLNLDPRNGSRWDPTQARAMMNYAIARNFTFFGFELGASASSPLSWLSDSPLCHPFVSLHSLCDPLHMLTRLEHHVLCRK